MCLHDIPYDGNLSIQTVIYFGRRSLPLLSVSPKVATGVFENRIDLVMFDEGIWSRMECPGDWITAFPSDSLTNRF